MSNRVRRSVTFALTAHLIAFLVLWVWLDPPHWLWVKKAPPIPLEVIGKWPGGERNSDRETGKNSGRNDGTEGDRGFSLRSLAPSLFGNRSNQAESGSKSDDGNSIDLSHESKRIPFMETLWRKLNSGTGYPEDFARERITGDVDATFEVGRDGVFLDRGLEIHSAQPLLKTYTAVAILYALREPFAREAWADEDRIPLRVRFSFQVYRSGENTESNGPRYFGNTLTIERRAWVRPQLTETIERIQNRFVPPIIILPGAVAIDFVRAYKMIQEWTRPDERDLRRFRMEILREVQEKKIRNVGVQN